MDNKSFGNGFVQFFSQNSISLFKTNTVYNFTNVYRMFLSRHNLHPIRLHMRGFNFVLGSHPDEYIIHYSDFRPNKIDSTLFNPPALCSSKNESPNLKTRAYAMTRMLGADMIDQSQISSVKSVPENHEFLNFIRTHSKTYQNSLEFMHRFGVFQKNLDMINVHNTKEDVTYKLGVTQFTDMELEEIQKLLIPNKFKRLSGHYPKPSNALRIHERGSEALPDYVNWLEKGIVNPPKDQGACGGCWAFGIAGSLEGAWAKKTGKLLSLSEQQILDCAWYDQGNSGCDGGFAGEGFNWIADNDGIALEADYPYLMVDGYCRANIIDSGVVVTGHVNVSSSEEALMDAVANYGPVSVAINAATPDFYYLQGNGVYNNIQCTGGINDLDHEVLVIGYGTDVINGVNTPYWLLKNSWGVIWGNKGFWKMARNTNMNGGMCGVHQQGRYPIV